MVKCQITGETGTSDTFYKAENGKYYKNEDVYIKWMQNTEYRKRSIDLLFDILGYSSKQKMPTIGYKKLSEFAEPYDYETVYETIVCKRKDIEYALKNKQFSQETGKIFYIMAIIQNSITDVWKKKVIQTRQTQTPIPMENDTNEVINRVRASDVTNLLGEL